MRHPDASIYLAQRFAVAAADAGIADSDDPESGWALAVDQAFRLMGVLDADFGTANLTGADIPKLLACLDYAGWSLLADVWAVRVDTQSEAGLNRKRSQAYDHAVKQRDAAAARAMALGVTLAELSGPPVVIQRVAARDPYGVRDGVLLGGAVL